MFTSCLVSKPDRVSHMSWVSSYKTCVRLIPTLYLVPYIPTIWTEHYKQPLENTHTLLHSQSSSSRYDQYAIIVLVYMWQTNTNCPPKQMFLLRASLSPFRAFSRLLSVSSTRGFRVHNIGSNQSYQSPLVPLIISLTELPDSAGDLMCIARWSRTK